MAVESALQKYTTIELSAENMQKYPSLKYAMDRCFYANRATYKFTVGSKTDTVYAEDGGLDGYSLEQIVEFVNTVGVCVFHEVYTASTVADMRVEAYIAASYATFRVISMRDPVDPESVDKISQWKTIPLRWFKAIYSLWLYGEDESTSMLYPAIEQYLHEGEEFRCIP